MNQQITIIANLQGTGAQTNQELIAAPGAGKFLRILSLMATVSAASEIIVSEGNNGAGVRLVDMFAPANGGILFQEMPGGPRKMAVNTALKISTTAGNVKVVVLYSVESPS